MTDFTTVGPGSSVGSDAPGLPPIDLPTATPPPQRRTPLKITVGPQDSDPYSGHAVWGAAPEASATPAADDPYGGHPVWGEQPAKEPSREIGALESAAIGAREGVTFGAYPAIHGAISAGKTKGEREEPEEDYIRRVARDPVGALGGEIGSLVSGLIKLGKENLIAPLLGHKDEGKATKIYREERDRAREEQESAETQNPKAYIGGQLASALAVPLGGGIRAATAAGRIARGAVAGGVGGAAYGLGGGISAGDDPAELVKDAGLGVVTGVGVGAAGGAAVEGIGKVARRTRDIVQGAMNPERVAERRVGGVIRDARQAGQLGIDVPTYAAAQSSGMPVHNIDIGGRATRDMGRALTNLSSEAADILEPAMAERIEGRSRRITDTIHRIFGGRLDAGADALALRQAARVANRPAYTRAYNAGDREIWSPELERLTSAPTVKQAMAGAVNKWKDWQVVDGFGGVNPGATVDRGGLLRFQGRNTGVPTFPNIQFWDYTARNIADKAEAARRAGKTHLAAQYGGLERQLKEELDRMVPEYREARVGARGFFGAIEAEEAGQQFVMRNADPREARRALAAMSAPERELFARGFADELTQALLRNDSWGTIKRAFTSPLAREKIETALGPTRARELEIVLRAEMVGRKTEEALLGNSTTARQWAGVERLARKGLAVGGHGAAGAIGTFELLKEGDYSAKDIIAGALILGSIRGGAHKIDAKVARKMAELLVSEDPATVRRGAAVIARSPQLFEALRRGTEAGSRVTARDLRPSGVGAGVATLYEHVMAEHEDKHHPHDNQDVVTQQGQ